MGDHTATASLDNTNYALSAEDASCNFTIGKARPVLGEVTAAPLACNGTVADIVLSRTNESVSGTFAVTSEAISDEGTVEYLFMPEDTENYDTVTGTVSVQKAEHTQAEAVEENRIEASCTEAGGYDLVVYCSVCGEEVSRETKVIEALGHTSAEAVTENFNDSTCAAAGSYDSVVYCSVCGAELSRETVEIPKKDHTPGDAVEENRVEASCTEDGSYDSVVYCSVCG